MKDGDFHRVDIPELRQGMVVLRLVGDSPLLMNNKLSVAERVAERYQGAGGTKKPKQQELSLDDEYRMAFYTLPSSPEKPPSPKGLYGVPASGIGKCIRKGVRPAGFVDNLTVGLIGRSFRVLDDEGGLCLIRHNGFVRDVRAVSIGSGQKTVPQMRHRPLFLEWEIHVRVLFNERVLSSDQLVNLAMHAGQYIGLCEMRAEKMQGECGGFVVKSYVDEDLPVWALDKHWGVEVKGNVFRVVKR